MPAERLPAQPRPPFGVRFALALIRLYQLLFSSMYAGSCRFVPSCSQYATESILTFGVVRGSWLAARRLSRCHPLGSHGFDPVPSLASSEPPKGAKSPRS